MTNLKMQHSGLVDCPEIEQLRPCTFFGEGLCPSCYAEPLLKLRIQNSKHIHKRTLDHGLIRLGTYIEVTPDLWGQFKAGEGKWLCCGEKWRRPDFPKRPYFMISRGLSPLPFYERLLADPCLTNLQVSTDILAQQVFTELTAADLVVPDKRRLAFFAQFDNVMFRFKTTPGTVREFVDLADELGIRHYQVMETTLRTPDEPHVYGTATPLEKAGWDAHGFGRCNTTCDRCKYENGMLLCAANRAMIRKLPTLERPPPPRHVYPQMRSLKDINWTREAARFLNSQGGKGTVREAYAWFVREFPVLAFGKPNYTFKIRVGIQRVADKVCECGTVFPRRDKWNLKVARACPKCGRPPPKGWTLKKDRAVVNMLVNKPIQ